MQCNGKNYFFFIVVFSNIISTGAKAKPLLQLKAKSGSAFVVLAGKEQKSNGGDCWFNASYRYAFRICYIGFLYK